MKNISRLIILSLLIFMLISAFAGCLNPPGIESVQQRFYKNQTDIQTVTTFLIDTYANGDNVYIDRADGTMSVTHRTDNRYVTEKVKIEDLAVLHAIDCLIGGEQYNRIRKSDNTVLFLQWNRFFGAGCGVLFIIDGSEKPSIQYLTELVPIADTGWYYYISDPDA